MSLSNLNRTRLFEVDFDNLDWKKLEELYKFDPNEIHLITGAFISENSKYGRRPYLSTTKHAVYLPAHRLADVETILSDETIVEQINSGHAAFTVVTYPSKKFGKDCYDVFFIDLP